MTDTKSAEERSRNMAAIKNKDTKPEVWLRKELFKCGYRYRKNFNNLPGHPDLWLAKYNTAIFVHGCFWHHHEGCKYSYMPKTRADFWKQKFENNTTRDREVREELRKKGVKCLVVWECAIKKMRRSTQLKETVIKSIEEFLNNTDMRKEI